MDFDFLCYYCEQNEDTLSFIANHCTLHHANDILKYRQKVLDECTGKLGYQTKRHDGIVPSDILKSGKEIVVHENLTFILDVKNRKKKLNTPSKEKEVRRNLNLQNEKLTTDITDSEEDELLGTNWQCSYPLFLENLESAGQLETYMKFNKLVASNEFPKDNICYLLFMDIVECFSCKNTSQMRYSPKTMQFWQIGFRLFHGKYLRFMSGLKNISQVLEGESESGVHDPLVSKVNFAVPSHTNLYAKDQQRPPLVYPGINNASIEAIKKHFGERPMKLAVDGEKISRGKGKIMGDLNCWGFEHQPTLNDRKEQQTRGTLFVAKFHETVDALEGKGLSHLTKIPGQAREDILTNTKQLLIHCNL